LVRRCFALAPDDAVEKPSASSRASGGGAGYSRGPFRYGRHGRTREEISLLAAAPSAKLRRRCYAVRGRDLRSWRTGFHRWASFRPAQARGAGRAARRARFHRGGRCRKGAEPCSCRKDVRLDQGRLFWRRGLNPAPMCVWQARTFPAGHSALAAGQRLAAAEWPLAGRVRPDACRVRRRIARGVLDRRRLVSRGHRAGSPTIRLQTASC